MANVPATDVLRWLNSSHNAGLNYRAFRERILAGQVPATRSPDGRYQVDEADKPLILQRLGLPTPQANAA